MTAAGRWHRRYLVIPATQIRARSWESSAEAPRLEKTIFIKAHQYRLRLLELLVGETLAEVNVALAEFP